jgi:F-type H+-transporting ATPase subunit gamma
MGRLRQLRSENVTLHLELSGKRAITYFRFQGITAEKTFTHFEDKPRFDEVEELANRYIAGYVSGQLDRVEVCYMRFWNAARQTPIVDTLLPLASPRTEASAPPASTVEYEFLPNARDILEEIVPVSFKVRLFKCFLDAAVSEQIARRVAMKAATENAGEMIKTLTRQYNRARQAQITKEIAEVIGGAEALK